ncbi:hypothetical protein [Paludisphaera sp.]|uniref:hypothetical protein n=1 Tax=Paludisphaera sp. TaxID=2017432 RepID=UPI00301D41BE
MNPPCCRLCGRDFHGEWFHSQGGGELVRFRDYRPLGEGLVGHPPGLEWFCREHAPAALRLTERDSSSALAILRERFGPCPRPGEPGNEPDPSLWVTAVGPNPARVFSIVHRASNDRAADVLTMLRSAPFEVARGWPHSFESLRAALVDAGATVEVRYE